jgi:SpoVK/Ycf46/Vps4 family AAA+-type ATPase
MEAKYRLMNASGVLSFEYETARFGKVGGLSKLKEWLSVRQRVFQGEAVGFGLEAPKGVLLLGVQGCGKSLAAKAVAGVWDVPLLRLDFGALYNKYIGETEKNLRDALRTAEVMAPCVLWVDEIEKGLAGGDGDDGVSRRVLGTLLTWMAERKKSVFLVATANDVTGLPPELLRKGRFDEIFFVDLPDEATRALIFQIHLKNRNLQPSRFDLDRLAKASPGFSGAEIEQAIVSSLYASLATSSTISMTHLLEELGKTKPLSVVMKEKIDWLRNWARERTVPAN